MSDHGEVQATFVSPEPQDLSGTTKFGFFYLGLSIVGLLTFAMTMTLLIVESADEVQAYKDSVKEAIANPKEAKTSEGTKTPAAKSEETEAPAAK